MIVVRKAGDRGRSNHGWLDSSHTFSFADYYDPEHTGFRTLRVINDDHVSPGSGFGTHPHRDMEIVSYVLDGALEHKDSMGTGSVIRPGDVQRMTAGTGITHSEWNHSKTEEVHFLQIWILPERTGLAPGYEQKSFSPEDLRDQLRLVASRDGRDGSLTLHQDAALYVARLSNDKGVHHELAAGRSAWLQVARGTLSLNGVALAAGDGATVVNETKIDLRGTGGAEAIVFDLA
jgi:redox-sensitive bicupin YhaK (pirin superfamily)